MTAFVGHTFAFRGRHPVGHKAHTSKPFPMRHRLSTLAQRWQCIDAGGAGIGEVFGRPSFIGWHPVFQCFLVWSLGWSEKELTSPVGQHIVVFGLLVPMSSQAGKELPSWRPIAPFASRCPNREESRVLVRVGECTTFRHPNTCGSIHFSHKFKQTSFTTTRGRVQLLTRSDSTCGHSHSIS